MQNLTQPITPAGPFVPPMAITASPRGWQAAPHLNEVAEPMRQWRVVCGNGHAPFARFFDDEDAAIEDAKTHNAYVHGVFNVLGHGIADVDRMFVNLPV